MQNVSRRNFLAGTAALTTVSLLAAHAMAQGAALREIRVAMAEDPQTLDPANHRNRTTETVIRNMTDGLVTRDPDMKLIPEVAESWEQIDPLTWEFKLRQDVVFHSGDKLTADDIVFTFNRLTLEGAMGGKTSPRKGLLAAVKETTKVDDYTVRMHLTTPWAFIIDYMPVQELVNKRHVERVGQDAVQTQIDGCGPYKLVEWRRGEAVIMERFEDYFGGKPVSDDPKYAAADRVVFRNIPDTSARLAGLLAGELDIIANLSPAQVDTVNASGVAEVMSVAGTTHFYLGFNHNKAPFNDLRFRQAINFALDRKLVIDRVMSGNGMPLAGPMSINDAGYNTDLQVAEFDLDKSKALLAEIGIAPGTEIVVDCIAANKENCEIICALLSRTGLTFRPQIWEGAVLSPTWRDPATRADRQMIFNSQGNSAQTTEILNSILGTKDANNIFGYSNADLDAAMAVMLTSQDPATAEAAGKDVQRIAVEDLSHVFLWVPFDLYGVSKKIKNWKPRADSRINLHNALVVG